MKKSYNGERRASVHSHYNQPHSLVESNFSSKENCDGELGNLLKTNKILVENKRHIYETKIKTYEQKIGKIQQLIKTAVDHDEKHNLYEKYCAMEGKKKEAQLKLHKIAKIQMQMMEVQQQETLQDSEKVLEDGLIDENIEQEWRIKTQQNCSRHPEHQTGKKMFTTHLNPRINRSTSISLNHAKKTTKPVDNFNQTCKPFLDCSDDDELGKGLDQSKFQLMSIGRQDGKATLYNQLMSCCGSSQSMKEGKSKNKSKQARDDISKENSKKNDLVSKEQQLKFKEAKLSLSSALGEIYELVHAENEGSVPTRFNPSELIIGTSTPPQFLAVLEKELNKIKESLHENRYRQNLRVNAEREIKILTENRIKINKDIAEMINKQRELLQSIDQLEHLKENSITSIISNLQQTCLQIGINCYEDVTKLEGTEHQISGLYDVINKNIQMQKVIALEKKEGILGLEYKLNMLKGQEEKQRGQIEGLREQISEEHAKRRQLEKQNAKLLKDREGLSCETNRLSQEIAEYEDLSGIRKNCYNDLQSKYNKLKSKKSKLESSIKTLESQQKQLKESNERIGQLIDRNEKYLNKINDEIKQRRMQREEIIRNVQKIDQQLSEKDEQLKQVESALSIKNQQIAKLQKKFVEVEGKIVERQKNIDGLSEEEAKIKEKILSEKKYLQEVLPQQIKQAQSIKIDLEGLVSKLQQNQRQREEKLAELKQQLNQTSQILNKKKKQIEKLHETQKKLYEENQELSLAKEELEDTVTQILTKKEDLFEAIAEKYTEIQILEKKMTEIQNIMEEKEVKVEELENSIHNLGERCAGLTIQREKIVEEIASSEKKLEEIVASIAFNEDEEQNLQQRTQQLKKALNRIVLEIAVRLYSNTDPQQQLPEQSLRQAMNPQIRYQIEDILQQISTVKQLKQRYNKQKQSNRKLKLDNDRLKKLYEIEESGYIE